MKTLWHCLFLVTVLTIAPVRAQERLRVLTWEGYITPQDVANANAALHQHGYDATVTVLTPHAQSADQMFESLRDGEVDISFLTLFFIKMQRERASRQIQPINTASPRLGNYKHLLPTLTRIPMGMRGTQPLYIPFAGGSYGFYVNRKVVSQKDVPTSWGDLLLPRWQGKYSLNQSQIWYNVAIASMVQGKPPYYLNDLAEQGQRNKIVEDTGSNGPLALTLERLYRGAGHFWDDAPKFLPQLEIVSSWGVEVKLANAAGGDWQPIAFKEGNLVWMDTINFSANLKGKRLEAAEVVANYFIGKEVQSRVASELSLVAVSALADSNPILKKNPQFFESGTFVPPYNVIADNLMTQMSARALKKVAPTR